VFVGGVTEVLHMMALGQYLVEEINEEILVDLGAEKFLETEISKGVDVFVLQGHEFVFCRVKLRSFWGICQLPEVSL
jgi:hypothetical protein